jgi:hypothetical protein
MAPLTADSFGIIILTLDNIFYGINEINILNEAVLALRPYWSVSRCCLHFYDGHF